MKKLSVIIITGAAGGIGRATALKFAANGYALALVDINASGLEELSKELEEFPCECLTIEGDLQQMPFVVSIIEKTIDKWGRIDVLINNAVWRTIETMKTMTEETWEKTLKISLTAPAFLAKHAAAVMEQEGIPGVIINISSVQSDRAAGVSPAYIACKGAIESLTYELAVLYGSKGIRVVSIKPGNIETDINMDYKDEKGLNLSKDLSTMMNDNTPLRRSGGVDEIANVSYWLSTEGASFITGTSILVDGGFFHNFNAYKTKKLQFPKDFS